MRFKPRYNSIIAQQVMRVGCCHALASCDEEPVQRGYWRSDNPSCHRNSTPIARSKARKNLEVVGLHICLLPLSCLIVFYGAAQFYDEYRSEERRVGKECRSRW